ncbi:unnamed protein product, partial [Brassica rapa subsp. narinosa]
GLSVNDSESRRLFLSYAVYQISTLPHVPSTSRSKHAPIREQPRGSDQNREHQRLKRTPRALYSGYRRSKTTKSRSAFVMNLLMSAAKSKPAVVEEGGVSVLVEIVEVETEIDECVDTVAAL